ncbi:MAG: hypothetical protein HN577_03255 [Rhodospirillaceae bacterium]|nr:hypothetical protein [Rhodospirillaceae bacterium]
MPYDAHGVTPWRNITVKFVTGLLIATFLVIGSSETRAQEVFDTYTHTVELRNATTNLDIVAIRISVSGPVAIPGRDTTNMAAGGNWLHSKLSPGERRSFDVKCWSDTVSALEVEELISWNIQWRDADGLPFYGDAHIDDDPCATSTIDLIAGRPVFRITDNQSVCLNRIGDSIARVSSISQPLISSGTGTGTGADLRQQA